MSILANLNVDESVVIEDKDVVGGGFLVDSGIYECTIAMAYLTESSKGALGVVIHLETADKATVRETIYFTSNKQNGQSLYYTDKQTGEKRALPGFTLLDTIAQMTAGCGFTQLSEVEKTIDVYNSEQKKDVATKVKYLEQLVGEKIYAGIIKVIEDKNQLVDNQYVPTGETRETNSIDKVFHFPTKYTVTEAQAENLRPEGEPKVEANFYDRWLDRWEGKEKNLAKGKAAGGAAGGFAPKAPTGKKSVFNQK